VAGSLPGLVEIPNSGTATYNGHIIGQVVNSGAAYIAAGGFNNTYNFATRSGITNVTGFDTRNYTGGIGAQTFGNPRDFTGTLTSSDGLISGTVNGSFFKGGSDPVQAMGGNFNVGGANYKASGIFAAQK
jgi:hypothetical protein